MINEDVTKNWSKDAPDIITTSFIKMILDMNNQILYDQDQILEMNKRILCGMLITEDPDGETTEEFIPSLDQDE